MRSFPCTLFQFEKPGRRENFDYPEMSKEAGINFGPYDYILSHTKHREHHQLHLHFMCI